MTVPACLNDLTDAERRWLAELSTGCWTRVTGGYACRGRPRRLTVAVFDRLAARGLAYETRGINHPRAALTAHGRLLRELDLTRRARRAEKRRKAGIEGSAP